VRARALTIATLYCARAAAGDLEIVGPAALFAPGIASTGFSDVRLTVNPDAHLALWFSRNRPGGAGGYDIWMSCQVRRTARR
jgi:hypothetical protein